MLRRCISTLVLIGYLAGQLAVVPHVHAGMSPQGHSSTPHMHLAWLGNADHSHGHSHGHQHRDSAGQTDPALSDEPSIAPCTTTDHDGDAIYLSDASRPERTKSSWEAELAIGRLALTAAVVAATTTQEDAGSVLHFREHPPDNCAGACALFLKLRTLRI